MKNLVIGIVIVIAMTMAIKWYNRPDNGIHGVGKNACLLEGECIIINWDATEAEASAALYRWQQIKGGE